MKIKTTHKPSARKNIVIAIGVIVGVIIIFTAIGVADVTHFFRPSETQTPEQKIESTINSQNKKNFIENESKDTTNDTVYQNHNSDDIVISTKLEANGSVTISTQLKNYSDGTCSLTITNGPEAYTDSAPVLYQPDFSSCAGFSVPSNALSHGTWQVTLEVASKGRVNTNTSTATVQ